MAKQDFTIMDGNFSKILQGLQGARDMANSLVTPEVRAAMMQEDLKELADFNKISDPKSLKQHMNKLKDTIKNK